MAANNQGIMHASFNHGGEAFCRRPDAHIEVYAADGTALDQDTFSSAALAIEAAKTARGMEPGSYAVVLSSDLRTVLHVEIY